jgi:hypothetical protein
VSGLPLFLAIGGLVVTAAGALLLAYDALHGPTAWYLREFFGARSWEFLRQAHERSVQVLRGLPMPLYTPEAIQRLVDEAEARVKALEWEGKERVGDTTISGLRRSLRLALWGLLLGAVGSLYHSHTQPALPST